MEQSTLQKSTHYRWTTALAINNEKIMGKVLKLSVIICKLCSDANGGLIIALAEMSTGSNFGIKINKPKKLRNLFEYFFGEDQGRYILEIDKNNTEKFEKILKNNNVFYENIGTVQRDFFEIESEMKMSIKDLYKINNQWYNNY